MPPLAASWTRPARPQASLATIPNWSEGPRSHVPSLPDSTAAQSLLPPHLNISGVAHVISTRWVPGQGAR
jgi:hypothetical protein